ncbi:hypothetical protein [Nocardiopsis alkaliphila]|uniref:hypothetical protein n=1 Tax=Nocardiopsis alkaliphila TaxID=225762 RepID=UPI0019552DDF|nr:hypothetical protein [Nocardiopsis alkaliphila]
MPIEPMKIVLDYVPLLPAQDKDRRKVFEDHEYSPRFDDDFEEVVEELIDLSVRLLTLLPDPSLSPDERLERLARVVPHSQLVTAHRRSVRHKLYQLRRRLDELVPDEKLDHRQKLEWLVHRLEELVPGEDLRPIQRLEKLGDYRSTDVGLAPWHWQ